MIEVLVEGDDFFKISIIVQELIIKLFKRYRTITSIKLQLRSPYYLNQDHLIHKKIINSLSRGASAIPNAST